MSERVVVGIVRRARGVRGELVVESQTDLPDRFEELKNVVLVTNTDVRPVTISGVRYQKGSEVWVTLSEIVDREAAKSLRGATLEIDIDQRPALPEGVYYYDQLIGLEVYDRQDRRLGKISNVYPRGGQDLYGLDTPEGEVLVPATPAIVKQVDLARQRMVIDPPAGLLDEHHED